jgi:hypothetical protein
MYIFNAEDIAMSDNGLLGKISFLHYDSYKTTLEMAEDGNMGVTHKAEILWPNGDAINSWVKIYSKDHPRGLINEAIGYIIAGHFSLPQPKHAGFLQYPVGWILDEKVKKSLSDVDLYRGYTFAWVTTDTQGMNFRPKLEELSKTSPSEFEKLFNYFKGDIQKWEKLPHLIAFDYAIHNEDRNFGNLLQLPTKDFCLIDHGEILTSSQWALWDLIAPQNRGWLLMHGYVSFFEENHSDEGIFGKIITHQNLIDCYQEVPKNITCSKEDLLPLLKDLLGDETLHPPAPLPPISALDLIMNFLDARSIDEQNFGIQCAKFLGLPTDSSFS